MSDQEIIDRLQDGDTEVLDEVYRHHRDKVCRYLERREIKTQNPEARELAHDLFVESLIALKENVASGRLTEFRASVSTYLTTVCRYKYYALRKEERRAYSLQENLVKAPLTEANPEEETVTLPAALRRMVREMDEKCRELITYFHFDGIPMKEVVTLTRETYSSPAVATVVKQRCLQKLKKQLQAYRADQLS